MLRVVLVDDEEDALNILEILLGEIGGVEIAGRFTNPLEALDAIKARPCNAVFLDIEMPGVNGMNLAKMIRAVDPDIQVIFTTAYSQYAIEAFELESRDYLLKPLRMERLQKTVERIRKALEDREVREPSTGRHTIVCMGGFSVHAGGAETDGISWRTNKEKELFAFLIHHRGRVADQSVILEALWPDYMADRAKAYLYTCVSLLRKKIETYRLNLELQKNYNGYSISLGDVWCDAFELEDLLDRTLRGEGLSLRRFEELAALYKGDYLMHCDYDWAVSKRDELSGKFVKALRLLARFFREQDLWAAAADCLRLVLEIVPESEHDGRELMRLQMRAGNRSEAIKTYRRLEQAIREELDVSLQEETVKLYEEILAMNAEQSARNG